MSKEEIELRDYFAAKALQGVLSNQKTIANISKISEDNNVSKAETLCMVCYDFADAMLKVRKQ